MAKVNFVMKAADLITANMILLKDAFLKIGRNEELTWQDTVQIICQNDKYMMVQYSKGGRTEFHIHSISGWNAEDKSWTDGSYAYSLESAMVVFLDKCGDNRIKSNAQCSLEEKHPDLTHIRLREIAEASMSAMFECDVETSLEFVNDTLDMSDDEKKYFGVNEYEEEEESEEEEW